MVQPLVNEIQDRTGRRPPVGMKMDIEGEEYALPPSMIVSDALCDLILLYIEPHQVELRTKDYTNTNIMAT